MHSSSADRADAIDLVASNLLGRAARLTRLLMRSGVHEISRTEVGVLATLSDGPRRITQLAMTEALAQPTVTQLIDKLEGRELVSRGHDVFVHLPKFEEASPPCVTTSPLPEPTNVSSASSASGPRRGPE